MNLFVADAICSVVKSFVHAVSDVTVRAINNFLLMLLLLLLSLLMRWRRLLRGFC
jgi:hypothetical protein